MSVTHSLINNQNEDVNRLLLPSGVNILSSPSLTPYPGSLCYDTTSQSVCYGQGTYSSSTWNNLATSDYSPALTYYTSATGAVGSTGGSWIVSANAVTNSTNSSAIVDVTYVPVNTTTVANAIITLNTPLPSGFQPHNIKQTVGFCYYATVVTPIAGQISGDGTIEIFLTGVTDTRFATATEFSMSNISFCYSLDY